MSYVCFITKKEFETEEKLEFYYSTIIKKEYTTDELIEYYKKIFFSRELKLISLKKRIFSLDLKDHKQLLKAILLQKKELKKIVYSYSESRRLIYKLLTRTEKDYLDSKKQKEFKEKCPEKLNENIDNLLEEITSTINNALQKINLD